MNAWASCSAAADRCGRALFAFGIHAYRACLRPLIGRECLFAVGCSEHVLRTARRDGSRAALRAFAVRVRTCRGDFSIGSRAGVPHALTRDGIILPLDQLAAGTRRAVELAYTEARERIGPPAG